LFIFSVSIENDSTPSETQDGRFMSAERQSTNSESSENISAVIDANSQSSENIFAVIDANSESSENIFAVIDANSMNPPPPVVQTKHRKKRVQPVFDEQTTRASARIKAKKPRLA
jgi:hypothetical protein